MKYCILDTESTIYQKGHPFSARNRLCLVGLRINSVNHIFDIEYSGRPYGEALREIYTLLSGCDILVAFNAKFDLNWLAVYGITIPHHIRIFDCQLAEFVLSHQRERFPSLDHCLAKYGLGSKLHTIYDVYWSKGIDTPEIPFETLKEYLEGDLRLTDELYKTLSTMLSGGSSGLSSLLALHNQDLRVLQEMEFNGIRIDWAKMEQQAKQAQEELDGIGRQILEFVPSDFQGEFNAASNDHLSLLLYGGKLEFKRAIPYQHTYKSGDKTGTVETRNRWETIQVRFERLVSPLDGTKLAKDGYWSASTEVLKQLSKPKKLISLLLRHSELSKILDTYLLGFPSKAIEMDWQDGYIHSTLNQCVAVTGRLSSSNPNQQNLPELFNEFVISRYADTTT